MRGGFEAKRKRSVQTRGVESPEGVDVHEVPSFRAKDTIDTATLDAIAPQQTEKNEKVDFVIHGPQKEPKKISTEGFVIENQKNIDTENVGPIIVPRPVNSKLRRQSIETSKTQSSADILPFAQESESFETSEADTRGEIVHSPNEIPTLTEEEIIDSFETSFHLSEESIAYIHSLEGKKLSEVTWDLHLLKALEETGREVVDQEKNITGIVEFTHVDNPSVRERLKASSALIFLRSLVSAIEENRGEIKNRQELKIGIDESRTEEESYNSQHLFETLIHASGWQDGAIDNARSTLIQEGFLRSVLRREDVAYLKSLDSETIEKIEEWPPELFEALKNAGLTLGSVHEFTHVCEVHATVLGETINGSLTPKEAVGFLKALHGLFASQFDDPEIQAAMDDRMLNVANGHVIDNEGKRKELQNKIETATTFLRERGVIRDSLGYEEGFSRLGFKIWELQEIKGFEKLSQAQQKLVLANLQDFQNTNPESLMGRVWSKIRGDEKITRGESSEAMKKYGSVLSRLVGSMARFGPKVHEENGMLLTDLVNVEFSREHRDTQYKASVELNRAAQIMARTPQSWNAIGINTEQGKVSAFMDTVLTKTKLKKIFGGEQQKHYDEYTKRLETYESAKVALSEALTLGGFSRSDIIRKLIEVDQGVHILQFVQTAPEGAELLSDISNEKAQTEISERFNTKEALQYMAIGSVARSVTRETLGWLSGPLVAMGIAGAKSWNKSAAELRERDREAQFGKVDTSGEALNIVHASRTEIVGKDGVSRSVPGLIEKTVSLVNRIYALYEDTTEDASIERARLLSQLESRVEYIEDKKNLNRINYGEAGRVPANLARLYVVLAEAKALLTDSALPKEDTVDARVETYVLQRTAEVQGRLKRSLEAREDTIRTARRAYQRKKLIAPTLKAGAFSLLGAGLFELFDHDRQMDEARTSGKLDTLKNQIRNALALRDDIGMQDSMNGSLNVADSTFNPTEDGYVGEIGGDDIQTLNDLAPEMQNAPLPERYTIQSGDTFTKILKEQIPELKNLSGQKQETAIANILKSLTPRELSQIGIGSDVNKIYAGESLRLKKLGEIILEKGILKGK